MIRYAFMLFFYLLRKLKCLGLFSNKFNCDFPVTGSTVKS